MTMITWGYVYKLWCQEKLSTVINCTQVQALYVRHNQCNYTRKTQRKIGLKDKNVGLLYREHFSHYISSVAAKFSWKYSSEQSTVRLILILFIIGFQQHKWRWNAYSETQRGMIFSLLSLLPRQFFLICNIQTKIQAEKSCDILFLPPNSVHFW